MKKFFKNRQEVIQELIRSDQRVLDVGFWGQGLQVGDAKWIHGNLIMRAKEVFGIDLDFDASRLDHAERYKKSSAEDFDFDTKFDAIFASEVIEHLSNPGNFLAACSRNIKDGGELIITTPNCFNLFNIAEKFTKKEPTVNKDHTCYFNSKTLQKLLAKNGWKAERVDFMYSLEIDFKESYKKKFLNFIYRLFSLSTTKFLETLVIVAKKA